MSVSPCFQEIEATGGLRAFPTHTAAPSWSVRSRRQVFLLRLRCAPAVPTWFTNKRVGFARYFWPFGIRALANPTCSRDVPQLVDQAPQGPIEYMEPAVPRARQAGQQLQQFGGQCPCLLQLAVHRVWRSPRAEWLIAVLGRLITSRPRILRRVRPLRLGKGRLVRVRG